MTTIWDNEDGTYESGCGCVYELRGNKFIVVRVNDKCRYHVEMIRGGSLT